MGGWVKRRRAVVALVVMLLVLSARAGSAVHEGTSALVFEPVAASVSAGAAGSGLVTFNGGTEPTTRWTATFRFTGLEADTQYAVVVQGRFGADGSAEAEAFTPICAFRADGTGAGGCWDYELGMRRLNVVQLRRGDEAGRSVVQATRGEDGPGSITSVPNRYSPTATEVVGSRQPTAAASPVASPPGG